MKTLLVLRHAKSSHDDPELDDHDRPLNHRGRTDAPRMGRLIAREGIVPGAVLASTALRARDTAERAAAAAGFAGPVRRERALYLAEPDGILEILRTVDDGVSTVLVVGHNPGLEELVEMLTGRSEHLPTAALARVRLPVTRWASVATGTRGSLVGFWRPKDLD